jgi:hypothetical protein
VADPLTAPTVTQPVLWLLVLALLVGRIVVRVRP